MSASTPDEPLEPEQGHGPLPDPAAFAGRRRRKRGHRTAHAEHPLHVNINSLLDVLSVILVFLMKSYSANVVQIKPSPDLQVPFSYSSAQVMESTAVTVTLKDILIDDVPVMSLSDGAIAENQRSSGGFLIDPLFAKLQETVEHQKKIAAVNKKAEFTGLVTIIADRNVPFSLLTQVMYTLGQAQYAKFKFAAIKSERV
ncbi:MAG: biopolymer transporter ExbD [Deltaproteobacteria bacterium]|nr:MAG: biopolymer transporter ExbD [Deltaproteobacteria bacterium]